MMKKTVAALSVAALCGTGVAASLPAAAASPDAPGSVQLAACNPCNPCKAKACNPCNPCAAKACNPCNPCAAKNPCNPCNPCAAKKN